jgi:hypothetical protein
MAYLQETWRGKRIREAIETHMPYLLIGETSVTAFVNTYKTLVQGPDSARARAYRNARANILSTAAAERVQSTGRLAFWSVLGGSIIAVMGASLFSFTVNHQEVLRADQQRLFDETREDELREFATGELLPRTPTEVVLVIPANVAETDPWKEALGAACVLDSAVSAAGGSSMVARPVAATLVDVGRPETGIALPVSQPGRAIFRIVTVRSEKCPTVVDGWVPSAWVTLPDSDNPSQPKIASPGAADSQGPSGESADVTASPTTSPS